MLEKKDTEVHRVKINWTVNFMWKVQDSFLLSNYLKRERKEPVGYQEHALPRESDVLLSSLHY